MKAALMEAVKEVSIVDDVDVAAPLADEVVVRTAAAGVCHTDLTALTGGIRFPVPMVMGHEGAGVVEEVGSAVTSVRRGERVVTTLSDSCGRCRYCLSGRTYLCYRVGRGRDRCEPPRLSRAGKAVTPFCGVGSFAQRIVISERAVAAVGDDIGLDRAALLGCGVLTGLGAVLRTARVEVGDSVAVLGCGGVGLSIVQGARIAGAARIIAIDPVAAKRDIALRVGATDVVDPEDSDPVGQVLELSAGGVDHAFEAVGTAGTIEHAFAMLTRGGTATVVGAPGNVSVRVPTTPLMFDRRLQGSCMGSNSFHLDIPAYVELYRRGLLLLDELVSGHLVLDEIERAWSDLRSGASARNVIVFDAEEC
ncbi:zinc-binding dehydrogenase [Mycobacterium intracellulare]|uniref:zinc-binding dehydrogenase n=1 Tax=Mycobacterium intracellulare TaxID=1767 RepID=UPI0034D71CE0